MESKIIQIDSKNKNYIKYFFLAIFFIVAYFVSFREEKYQKNIINYERTATIINIYRDKNEHNFLFVKYSNGSVRLLDYPYKIGDSISKKKGDSIEYIYRNGTILENNLLQQARKKNLVN